MDFLFEGTSDMLRFYLKRLIAEKELEWGKRISMSEISESTGIHVSTLSRLANHKAVNTSSANIEALCDYFECRIQDLVEYIPDKDQIPENRKSVTENGEN